MEAPGYDITKSSFDGVVFDLDGVITRTAAIHSDAWKALFDEYLETLGKRDGKSYAPFDPGEEYRRYIDGKSRYDGIESFLEKRGIDLPRGSEGDGPDMETVCGLGNRKNAIFHTLLREKGVQVFDDTISLIHELRRQGWKVAVISASKNCRAVLDSVGIFEWFDEVVNGVVSEQFGLKGKPNPDIFLEAARRLEIMPHRSVVVEDAVAGITAATRAGVGLVVGVNRGDYEKALLESGADIVLKDLSRLRVDGSSPVRKKPMGRLPAAMENLRDINERMGQKQPALFLDYDGTLTPIVKNPEEAFIGNRMKECLQNVSERYFTAVISGRDLPVLKDFVQLESVYFAGSHGFDIAGPAGFTISMQKGKDFLPALDKAQTQLESRLSEISGAGVERKKFSIAVHYRNVADDQVATVKKIVRQIRESLSGLRTTHGKKVLELQPDIEWHKGKSVLWLMEALNINTEDFHPIYIGDDITDEDAFESLLDRGGTGIVVKGSPHPTSALYTLENTQEVASFLNTLLEREATL